MPFSVAEFADSYKATHGKKPSKLLSSRSDPVPMPLVSGMGLPAGRPARAWRARAGGARPPAARAAPPRARPPRRARQRRTLTQRCRHAMSLSKRETAERAARGACDVGGAVSARARTRVACPVRPRAARVSEA
jgi:hypothetical protein